MLDSVHRGDDEDAKLAAIDRILEQNDDALFDAFGGDTSAGAACADGGAGMVGGMV